MAASLARLEESHPVEIHWRSYELRPKGSPPIPPEYRARIDAGRPRLYAIPREQYGLELKQGPFGIDSRPALIGAKFAEAMGVGPTYYAAVMRAYWQEGKNIGEIEVLADIAVADRVATHGIYGCAGQRPSRTGRARRYCLGQ